MKRLFALLAILLSMAVVITGCSGGGGGGGGTGDNGGGGSTTSTTSISGKVTLSNTVASSPSQAAKLKALAGATRGKPGSKSFYAAKAAPATLLGKTFNAPEIPLDYAWVYLFNADHPEWLYPVAQTTTDGSGIYTLTKLANAAQNGNAYTDGADIPAGNYTFMAWKSTPGSTKITAVVQAVVTKLDGPVSVNLLDAVQSTSSPKVITMFGVPKNTDGTQTWGPTTVPANAALQITFSMPMWRDSIKNGITISPAVSGKWTLSADWLTATFYPDAGVTLATGTEYTVTVQGAGSSNPVTNVFGNTIASNAVGKFTAASSDEASPSAIVKSPETSTDVTVVTPVRIASNKLLDVNSLTLTATPTLGAKPGVGYVGEDSSLGQYKYIYEFILANPLQLGTTYDITVSGGKGLNGKTMNALTYSFTTMSASTASGSGVGIDATATTDTQNAQAAVADVFGKWVRSLNDRNLTQFQSLMSPEFYMEYDAGQGIDKGADVNRDGRYSFTEFSEMIGVHAFPEWTYCGTTMTGTVVGTINVVGDTADFEFKLSAVNTINDAQCAEAAPKGSLYTTLKNKNGAWIMVRASEGIDTRTRPITFPNVVSANLYEKGLISDTLVPDGGQVSAVPMDGNSPIVWKWTADATVTGSYIALIVDQRDPRHGVAIALPSTATNIGTDQEPTDPSVGGKDVSSKFGFETDLSRFNFVEGGLYSWEIIGLGSIGVNDITTKSDAIVLSDVVAISSVKNFSIFGTFKELSVVVKDGGGAVKTFNEMIGGYDLGSSSQAVIELTTPNTASTQGYVNVSGSGWQGFPVTLTNGTGAATVNLYQGQNWVCADDGSGMPGGLPGTTTTMSLVKCFSIKTTGGIPPVVMITSIVDDISATPLTGDSWSYYQANSGAKKVTVSGTVSDPAITQLQVNVNNESGAYAHTATIVNPGAPGTFTVTVDIYQGNNWIDIGANVGSSTGGGSWTSAHAGVYTDTGTTWVPPFANINVVTATKTGEWGSSQDWDASSDADDIVTISGKLKVNRDGNYNIWSDGSSAYGTLTVLADGSFTLDVTLYNGWNNVSLNDADGTWFGINIYTTKGKQVVKTVISQFNGAAYDGNYNQNTNACTVTLSGTAPVGPLEINWSGYGVNQAGSLDNYYDPQTVEIAGAAGSSGSFSVTVPIISGTGSYNYVDLYDANFKWTGIYVITSGACSYVDPVLTVDPVRDSTGAVLSFDSINYYYDAGSSNTVTIEGTSTRPGRTINVDVGVCGTSVKYQTTSATAVNGSGTYDWSVSGVSVYDNVQTYESNYISISDGPNWRSINVHAANGQSPPPPPIQITSVTNATVDPYSSSSCGNSYWDAGTNTTVTINGTTTGRDGTGNYTDSTGTSHQFTITGGTFSITVPVYDGYNNIGIGDADYHWMNVGIYTMNGQQKPQFMIISSPTPSAIDLSGIQTVSGSITDAGFNPDKVMAYISVGVWNAATTMCDYTYEYYSSDVYDQVNYGDLPVTYNPVARTFSFDVDFSTGPGSDMYGNICSSYIDVSAFENATYTNHGYSINVNTNYPSTPYWYKSGAKVKTRSIRPVTDAADSLRFFKARTMP